MDLGKFSISLAVKDIRASREFYTELGFKVIGGDESHNWLIVRNVDATIGLFQDMFADNMLTFQPRDVRSIQRTLRSAGMELEQEVDEDSEGPGAIMLRDPDGNVLLLDQLQ